MDNQFNQFQNGLNEQPHNQQYNQYNNPYNNPYTPPTQNQQNKFAMVSLILGLLAFFTSMFMVTPFIFGGLSILFAFLSKRSTEKMSASAIAGISASVMSIICLISMIGMVYYLIFNVPQYREMLNEQYEQMYGQSFDEMLEDIENGTFDPNSLNPQ